MLIKDRLQLDSQRVYTDEGFLKVPARIGRTGIQYYSAAELGRTDLDPKTPLAIYRPEHEVFKPESMQTFGSKPVTDDHPPVLVTSKNAKTYTIGLSGETVSRDGDYLLTTLTITDQATIEKIQAGKCELSNGYICGHVWESGQTASGEKYDAMQVGILGNHIAIVDQGRAGQACRVSDSKIFLTTDEDQPKMKTIIIDGVEFEVSDQVAQAVNKLQTRLNDAEKEVEEKDEEMQKKEDEMEEAEKEAKKSEDSLKAKLDDALSKVLKADQVDKLIADRMALIEKVKTVAPTLDWAGKSADQLMREAVGINCPNVQFDSVSSDYVQARFDMLLETVTNDPNAQLNAAFGAQVTTDKKTETRSASQIARDKMIENSRNAWKRGDK